MYCNIIHTAVDAGVSLFTTVCYVWDIFDPAFPFTIKKTLVWFHISHIWKSFRRAMFWIIMNCVPSNLIALTRASGFKFLWLSDSHVILFLIFSFQALTHWGQKTLICVGNQTIVVSSNGLAPGRHQAIIWTNAGPLWSGPLGTNSVKFQLKFTYFHLRKCICKCRQQNGGHFVSAKIC